MAGRARTGVRETTATAIAVAAFIAAAWCFVWNFLPSSVRPYSIDRVFAGTGLYTGPSLFLGLLLLVVGGGLLRRLRAALLLVLAMQVTSLLTTLFTVPALTSARARVLTPVGQLQDVASARIVVAVSIAVAIGIGLSVSGCFQVRLAAGSRRSGLIALGSGLALSGATSWALLAFFPGTLSSATERATWAILSAVGMPSPRLEALHRHAGPDWVATVSDVISALSLLMALWLLLRSVRTRHGLSADQELAVRRLIARHGDRDSLSYFATRRDKDIVFAPDESAAITYRVEVSACVASADPVGDSASWPAAIAAWQAVCQRHGWYPAALSASVDGAHAYVAAGLKALTLGDEATIDVERFSLTGPGMQPVRRAVSRLERAGCTSTVRRQEEIPAEELAALSVLADAWRGNATERGFSMALNRFGDATDGRCVIVTASDAASEVIGLLSFVPWGRRGLSLDVMRRSGEAENGVTEFMVAALMRAADGLGVRRVSLNFAMFRGIFSTADQVGAGPITRAVDRVLGFASRFWQLESLYRANDKYHPQWSPRFLCYDPALTVTRAAIAAAVAEGFLPSLDGPRGLSRRSTMAAEPGSGKGPGDRGRDGATRRLRTTEFVDQVRRLQSDQNAEIAPVVLPDEQQRWRRVKLQRLTDAGCDPYPARVPRDTSVAEVVWAHAGLAKDARTGRVVSLTGRVRALRQFGGLTFVVVQEAGVRIQALLTADRVAPAAYRLFRRTVDLGDLVSLTGEVIASHTSELTLDVAEWRMASKALRPVPGLGARFSDPEARARNRTLDLLVNDDAMDLLRRRSDAVTALRSGFEARGFTEVETPMLQSVHGGASARPFSTWINAYGMRLNLRIAPELHLKRLAVAGMPKIFELNRNFRNEGADATHNPEFTSLEAYQAYADYTDMRLITRELIIEVATRLHGEPIALRPNRVGGHDRVRIDSEWMVVTVHDAVSRATGTVLTSASTRVQVADCCRQSGVHVDPQASAGALVTSLYDALVERQTVLPTFYVDFPIETSPLARAHRQDPALAERWDLVAFGAEIGTAYSELVDPLEQRARLTQQSLLAAGGDREAMHLDEDFLAALELGMPPTGGLGIGVDRLVMMLTGVTIRGTLAFPFVKP